MITAEIKVGFDSKRANEIVANITSGLKTEMKAIGIDLQGFIKEFKLTGGNPLNRRSGNLSRSINEALLVEPEAITTVVGTRNTARYGFIHEFGGTFTIPEHLSTSRLGNKFTVREHSATFPERSYMRSALAFKKASFVRRIETVVKKAANA